MPDTFNPKKPPSSSASYAKRFAWELLKENRSEGVFDVWLDDEELALEVIEEFKSFGCTVRRVKPDTLRVIC